MNNTIQLVTKMKPTTHKKSTQKAPTKKKFKNTIIPNKTKNKQKEKKQHKKKFSSEHAFMFQ